MVPAHANALDEERMANLVRWYLINKLGKDENTDEEHPVSVEDIKPEVKTEHHTTVKGQFSLPDIHRNKNAIVAEEININED